MRRKKLVYGLCASVIATAIISIANPAGAIDFTELPGAGAAVALGEGSSYEEVQGTIEAYVAATKDTTDNKELLQLDLTNEIEVIRAEDQGEVPMIQPVAKEALPEVIVAEKEVVTVQEEPEWTPEAEVAVLIKGEKDLIPVELLEIPGADVSIEDPNAEFSKLVIAQVDRYVNVRAEADTESEVVGKLYDNSVGTLIEEKDGWYQIESGKVKGYVKSEFCVTGKDAVALVEEVGTRVATVKTDALKVRTEASLEAPVLGLVPNEEDLTVLEETDGWVKVSVEEGDGYVSAEYVDLRTDFVQAESREDELKRLAAEEAARREALRAAQTTTSMKKTTTVPEITGGSEMGRAVVEYACQFVGNPYVYGGSSLTNGADCSGFVMSVYANFGVSLPHSSKADRSVGYAVDGLANAQPGDLICYSGHVALYIGNNQIVHASSSKTGIIISNADYKTVLAVRRIF
ncbi:MAG: SH3 domain-containing protein [Lachnospiraceae bacterium]|nr:SH3 domain-containing protein [Lachnospiraceae bacterium]